ncbi:MAG: hypothetical protein J6331_04390, partial [Lentisphaeria bacterium]|nr:hypothetical protein [Lentisphaeria bacterium]
MKKLFPLLAAALLSGGAFGQSKFLPKDTAEKCRAKDLLFLVTFDKHSVNADFAGGDKYSTTMRDVNLGLRGVIGFDGKPAYKPESGEALRFPVEKNVDPEEYLSREEIDTLEEYTESLKSLPQYTEGQKEAAFLAAM